MLAPFVVGADTNLNGTGVRVSQASPDSTFGNTFSGNVIPKLTEA